MYDTSERGRSIKLGADAPSFVLKPKLEGDTLESHVTVDVITFCEKYFFKKFMRIIYYSIQSYGLKMLESQDRTVMTLGKLKFSDISFSSNSKYQTLLLSEHQLKWISRSQETWGKYLLHYCREIFGYCKNAGICTLFPHILFVISGTKSDKFLLIFLCL